MYINIDKEKLINVLCNALDNTNELLTEHDNNYGRTTVKNKFTAEDYEKEIKEIENLIRAL